MLSSIYGHERWQLKSTKKKERKKERQTVILAHSRLVYTSQRKKLLIYVNVCVFVCLVSKVFPLFILCHALPTFISSMRTKCSKVIYVCLLVVHATVLHIRTIHLPIRGHLLFRKLTFYHNKFAIHGVTTKLFHKKRAKARLLHSVCSILINRNFVCATSR